jgi:hypothetical protein
VPRDKLIAQARDELFSHINRCGVLQATQEDQSQWMDETIEYIGERYPDLADAELRELHAVGMRFCQPAISRGAPSVVVPTETPAEEPVGVEAAQGALAGSAAEHTASGGDDANAA